MPPVSISNEVALFAAGHSKLADALSSRSPFASVEALVDTARSIWWGADSDANGVVVLGVSDWLESLEVHPRIGSEVDIERGLAREKKEKEAEDAAADDRSNATNDVASATASTATAPPLSSTAASATEQAGADAASSETKAELARWNAMYERKFGYIYIVCAPGRSGEDLLQELKRR